MCLCALAGPLRCAPGDTRLLGAQAAVTAQGTDARAANIRRKRHVIAGCRSVQYTLAERLRRRPAKPMGSPRVGSNPTGVVLNMSALVPRSGLTTGDGVGPWVAPAAPSSPSLTA